MHPGGHRAASNEVSLPETMEMAGVSCRAGLVASTQAEGMVVLFVAAERWPRCPVPGIGPFAADTHFRSVYPAPD